MKNKFIALALVTLSIATTTVSCTKEGLDPTDVKSQNVETTSVDFTVNADNGVSATGRVVDRNAAPLYVDNVTIWANSLVNTNNASETFTFGTAGAGVLSGFALDGVALGTNTFGATSNASETNNRLSLSNTLPTSTTPSASSDVLDIMKTHVPYIRCASENVTAVIKKTGNDKVVINMKTDYGRILAKFVQSAPDADNYYVTVSATVPDMDDMGVYGTKTLPAVEVTPTTNFEWSNPYAVFINKATFTIRVYDKVNGVQGQLLNTITKEVQISKATTKLCTFTVKNSDVETNIEAGKIELKFPEIANEVIND